MLLKAKMKPSSLMKMHVIASGNDDGANAMNDGPSESSEFKLRDGRAPGKDKRQDSLLSRGRKRNREEDCAREVLKLLDGNQRRFTEEENHSRPSHGMKRAQHLVQPLIAISINNV